MISNKYYHHSTIHPILEVIHDHALIWVNHVLAEKGLASVEQIVPIHSMAWSVVGKVVHEEGVWYFKAVSQQLEYELDASEVLSRFFPEQTATFIAANTDQRFMLVDDLGQVLYDTPKIDCFGLWRTALADYSTIQLETSRLGREIFPSLPDRRLELIPSEAMPIIERCVDLTPRDGERAILHEDVEWIRQYFSQWEKVMADINSLPIPNAVHHGDLHGGNIAMRDRPVVFDWGDSSWSHPFVTFFVSVDACQSHLGFKDGASLAELQEAYLSPWLEFGTMSQLNVVIDRVNKVSPLVMLLSWAYAIGNKADERVNEWEGGLCTWVNEFLRLNRN